jgi:hypothetical protein
MLHEYRLNFRLNGLKVDLKTLIDNKQTLETELKKVKDRRNNVIILRDKFTTLARETVDKAFKDAFNLANGELVNAVRRLKEKYPSWLYTDSQYDWWDHLTEKVENVKEVNVFYGACVIREKLPQFYHKVLAFINHIGQQNLVMLSEFIDAEAKLLCDQLVQNLQQVTSDIHQNISTYVSSILRAPTSKLGILNESTTVHFDKYLVMNLLTPTQRKQQHRRPWYLSEFVKSNDIDYEKLRYLGRRKGSQEILASSFRRFSEAVQRYVQADLRQLFNDYFDQIEERIQDLLKTLQTSLADKYYCKDTTEFENDLKESRDMCAEYLQLSTQYKKMLVEYFLPLS